jgi:hypothetical protein
MDVLHPRCCGLDDHKNQLRRVKGFRVRHKMLAIPADLVRKTA